MQGHWLDFRDASYDQDDKKCFDTAIMQGLKVKKEELCDEVPAMTFCKTEEEKQIDLRRFVEQ